MPSAKPNRLVAALAVAIEGTGKRVRLFPAGEFTTLDGRKFLMDDKAAASLLAAAAGRKNKYTADYEHQALYAKDNGKEAPASATFTPQGLEWVPGDGFYATDVAWTKRAAAYIDAEEYLYISPLFAHDKDGRPTALINFALTNTPAIDDQQVVSTTISTENILDLTAILAALGLTTDATPEAMLAAITALKSDAAAKGQQVAALSATQYDSAKFVPLAQYAEVQNQLAALTAKVEAGEREGLLVAALADGRILPVAKEYWSTQPIASLKGYLAVAQPIVALSQTQTQGKPPVENKASTAGLDASALAVCSQMGVSPEAFAAARAKLLPAR